MHALNKIQNLCNNEKKVILSKKILEHLLNDHWDGEYDTEYCCSFKKVKDFLSNLEKYDLSTYEALKKQKIKSSFLFSPPSEQIEETFLYLYKNGFFENAQDKYKIGAFSNKKPYQTLIKILSDNNKQKKYKINPAEISDLLEYGIEHNVISNNNVEQYWAAIMLIPNMEKEHEKIFLSKNLVQKDSPKKIVL